MAIGVTLQPVACQVGVHGPVGTGIGVSAAEATITSRYDNGTSLVPALGEQWSAALSNRLLLHWAWPDSTTMASGSAAGDTESEYSCTPQRAATITKSGSMPIGTAFYRVGEEGVRDIAVSKADRTKSSSAQVSNVSASLEGEQEGANGSANKRMRPSG